MGDIIAFSAKDCSPGRATPAKLEGAFPRAPGQILLFTGVRYQHDDAPRASLHNDSRPDPTSLGGAGGGKRRKGG